MGQSGQAKQLPPAAESAKLIIRASLKASLATIESNTGFPYGSLVTVAFEPNGTPLLLLSRLAVHTRNLLADHRASLLFDASDGAGDPLAGGRVTVIGNMEPVVSGGIARRRFLARHPGAEMYVDFPDFGFWRLSVERAHYIGGFGRIVDLAAGALLSDVSNAQKLIDAEAEIVAHMNTDHADVVQLYATQLAGAEAGAWRMSGVDPMGFDLVNGERAVRIGFASCVTNPEAVRAEFIQLAKDARTRKI